MAIYKLTLILAAAARASAFGTLPRGASPSESIDLRSGSPAALPSWMPVNPAGAVAYPIQYAQG